MDLEEIRVKQPDDLSNEEKAFLKANEADLTEDEKQAFSDIITEPAEIPDEGGEYKVGEGEKKEEKKTEDEPTPEEKKEVATFKTQEELDEYLEGKRKEWRQEEIDAEERKKREAKLVEFFKEGELPQNWNDAFNRFLERVVEDPSILAEKMAPYIAREFAKIDSEQRGEIDKYNKEFDQEYDQMAKEGLVPKRDTKEGKEVDQQISLIGAMHGKTSLREAYDLWKIIPKDKGGGLDVSGGRSSAQKKKASMVGEGRGEGSSEKGKRSYKDLTRKSMDDLLESEL